MLTHRHQKMFGLVTFIGQNTPDIRRKLQSLDGTLGMNPFQLVDLVFKVYHVQETRRLKQAAVLLGTVQGNQKERQGPERKKEKPTRKRKAIGKRTA